MAQPIFTPVPPIELPLSRRKSSDPQSAAVTRSRRYARVTAFLSRIEVALTGS